MTDTDKTIAHNDAADGFERDPFPPDPDSAELGDEAETELGAALDAALEAFSRDDLKLTGFEALVRERLAGFGPTLGQRLEQVTKQLATIEASMAFVVSYVNTLALPVRDPLDLPEPPAHSAEYLAVMAAAEADIRGRHNLNTLPGRTKPNTLDAGVPTDNDPIACAHPNDCQFPRCLCGTEFAAMQSTIEPAIGAEPAAAHSGTRVAYTPHDCLDAMDELREALKDGTCKCQFTEAQLIGLLEVLAPSAPAPVPTHVPPETIAARSAAIESTRGPYAKVYDQNHAEPGCTHTFSGAGGVSTGRTSLDGSHPMGLSAQDVNMLRDQAALTEVLAFMDRFAAHPDNTVPMTLTPTEFRAVRHAIAHELGSYPQPDPHPLAYRIPNDMAQVLNSLRVALNDVTASGLPGADVHLSKGELRSLMAVVRGFKGSSYTIPAPEEEQPVVMVDIVNRTNIDGQTDNDRARKVLNDLDHALNGLAPNTYAPTRLQFTAHEIACAVAALKQAVPSQEWESGKAYWLGSDGQFYVLDTPKGVKPLRGASIFEAAYGPHIVHPSPVPSFQTIAAAISSYWWASGLSPGVLLRASNDGWRLTARAADSLASHITNTLTGAPNWPSPMAEAVGTPFTKSRETIDRAMDEVASIHNAQAKGQPQPSLLDQARQTHDAIWTRIISETHTQGTLRDALTAPPFHRAWAALASLVDARAILAPHNNQTETLVMRLDAVRAMHKVLLCVRSALLQKCNTSEAEHG